MEIATAILMSAGLAIALLILNSSKGATSVSLEQYLFGSIITISLSQVIMLFVLAAVVLLGFILFLRPLYVMTFDEDTAFVDGLPVRWISIAFNIVTGIAEVLRMTKGLGRSLSSFCGSSYLWHGFPQLHRGFA